jgi:spermidine/putrescine transport system substrate-binding protein
VASLPRYRSADLIEPWDTAKIPEFANINPALLNSSYVTDDGGVWFIPTDYAYTAVAYNTTEVPAEDVATLQVFADPKYANRISLPDNSDDIWALAFLATGVTSWDNVTDEQFQAAADWLRTVHPNVRAYWADPAELSQLMATGEVLVSWSWNDGVALLQAEEFPIGFNRAPAEGASTWYCGYVNMKDAPGSEDKAYDFINSVLAHGSAKVAKLRAARTHQAGIKLIGLRLLLLDRMDVLDIPGRLDLVDWLDDLSTQGEIDTALVFATLKTLPNGLPPSITAHWIEDGLLAATSSPTSAGTTAA